jgi:hypothetical protein
MVFKIKFTQWYLRSQEAKIMESYHPNKIIAILENGVNNNDLKT